jgi:VWFA-related protein
MKPAAALVATLLAPALFLTNLSGQQPTFHAGVDLVDVAVVVSDDEGRFVTGLTAADFEVFDKGIPQKVAFFDRVSIPVWRGEAGVHPERVVAADVFGNERPADGRLFVLVLDALHVSPANLATVRLEARRFVEEHVGPDDLVAVIAPGAIADASQDFTGDKARLLAAINHFSGTAVRSATLEVEQERLAAAVAVDMPILHGGRDPSDGDRADRARSLSSVLEALAGHLARVERRRKALLLFSEGVDYNTADFGGIVQRYAFEVQRAIDNALGALMRSNVSVYAVDPRGLSTADTAGEKLPFRPAPTAPRADRSLPPADFSEPTLDGEYSRSMTSLRLVAESTGGFALVAGNDPGEAFDRIVRECSDYYVLGYTPGVPAKPGEFRPIRVRVNRPGVRVIARSGYVVSPAPSVAAAAPQRAAVEPSAEPPRRLGFGKPATAQAPPAEPQTTDTAAPKGLHEQLAWLLSSPLPVGGLPIRVHAASFRGDGKKAVVQIVTEVQGEALVFVERGGRFESRLELASFTVDSRGHGANGHATTIDLKLPRTDYDRVRASGIRWLSQLELAPGRYQLRVAGRAPASARAGLVTADVDVPAFAGVHSLSGVSLTSAASATMLTQGRARQASQALGTPPTAERVFVAGDQVAAVFEVYSPVAGAETLALRLEQLADGLVVTERSVPIQTHGSPGVASVDLQLFAGAEPVPPGHYLLRVRLDGREPGPGTERTVPFHVIPPGPSPPVRE